jgi:3-keto-5-aminohexanoate cleavage enzyme
MVTVAPTGAETSKQSCPSLPTSTSELLETAQRCEVAGAAMIHIHVRDDRHQPTLELSRLKETVDALREGCGLVVQLSTGGSVHDGLKERLRVLEAAPESCSITMGTTNFGSDVFMNPWDFIVDLYQLSQERRIVPEFELFDLGQVHSLARLLDAHGLPYGGRVHCDLVMNVPGGMPGTAAALNAAVAALPRQVTSWSATGIGRAAVPVALSAMANGGHLRVGMEDCLRLPNGQAVRHNEELVARAAELGWWASRPSMRPDEARGLLGIHQP